MTMSVDHLPRQQLKHVLRTLQTATIDSDPVRSALFVIDELMTLLNLQNADWRSDNEDLVQEIILAVQEFTPFLSDYLAARMAAEPIHYGMISLTVLMSVAPLDFPIERKAYVSILRSRLAIVRDEDALTRQGDCLRQLVSMRLGWAASSCFSTTIH